MVCRADHEVVAIYIVLTIALLIGPLAVLYGADSRPHDERYRRTWWPGTPNQRY
jgi:hypothetical protein